MTRMTKSQAHEKLINSFGAGLDKAFATFADTLRTMSSPQAGERQIDDIMERLLTAYGDAAEEIDQSPHLEI